MTNHHHHQQLIELFRKLRPLQIASNSIEIGRKALNFNVLTYNLLSQHHINSEVYPYCVGGVLKSAYRRTRLTAELEAYGALDVAAFQELAQYEEFWKAELEKAGRLKTFYAAKEGGRDGICIAYDPQKYSSFAEEVISFAPLMSGLEAVPNIAQIIGLNTPVESVKMLLSNTHLFWRPDFDCLRVLQAHRLRKRMEELKAEYGNGGKFEVLLVMCGDWNSDPKSAVYFLMTGNIDKITRTHWSELIESHSRLLSHPLESSNRLFAQVLEDFKKWPSLTSAYSCYRSPSDPGAVGEPPYTSINSYVDTLDYIFTDFRKVCLLDLLMLPADEIVKGQTALPNEIYSSDHLALKASFCTRF